MCEARILVTSNQGKTPKWSNNCFLSQLQVICQCIHMTLLRKKMIPQFYSQATIALLVVNLTSTVKFILDIWTQL